jgi:hypothetical protein
MRPSRTGGRATATPIGSATLPASVFLTYQTGNNMWVLGCPIAQAPGGRPLYQLWESVTGAGTPDTPGSDWALRTDAPALATTSNYDFEWSAEVEFAIGRLGNGVGWTSWVGPTTGPIP